MANVLSLALRVTADASRLRLDPVQRALVGLGEQADKLTGQFAKFTAGSAGAAQAQEDFARRSQALINSLRDNGNATQFAAQFEKLSQEATALAAAFEEGARVTESVRTEEERRATELERLDRLLQQNAISQETYDRAVAEASGANREAARAAAEAAQRQAESERARASAAARAAQIIQSTLTPTERYARELAELQTLQRQGLLTQEQFNRAVASARKPLEDAAAAAGRLRQSGRDSTLQFNELSGVFAALPGPLGNIAGRISGLSSAGEGLSRIFAGGLSQGIGNVAASVTQLINPVTLALGGITAFGAGAVGVVRGLTQLEDRVEKLGNTADKLGVSFEFIQTLEESANRSGTSIESVSAAFGRLQRSVLGVDEESKAAQKALASIGVTAEEIQTLDPAEQYQRIGAALTAIEDPAKRTAAATQLFGRAGAELLPFFNNLKGAQQDLATFSATLSGAQRNQIDRLGSAFDQVGVSLRGLGQSVLTPFIGIVEGLARTFAGLVNVVTNVAQAIGSVLGPVLNEFGSLFGGVADGINATVGFFRSFFVSTDSATEKTQQLAEATKQVRLDPQPPREYERAIASVTDRVREARKEAEQFGIDGRLAASSYAVTIRQLNEEFRDGRIRTLDGLKVAIDQATQAYQQQIGVIREAAEEERRRAEAEQNTVRELIDGYNRANEVIRQFGGDESRARAADNLRAVYAEAERVEVQLAAARKAGDQEAIAALDERLETLAAIAIREDGIASGAAAARERQRQEAQAAIAERERLDKEARDRRIQAERQAEQQLAAERQRVNNLVNEQLALAQFGGDSQRLAAARNVQAIQAEIARVEAEVEKARQAGNTQVVQAGTARIAQLDQVAAKERDIASGRAAREAEIAKRREEAAAREQQLVEQFAKQQEQAIQQQQAAAQQQAQAQQKAFEEQARAAAAEAERQDRRIRALNSIGQQSVSVGDIRSTEGANAFLQAAAGALDPTAVAIAEARAQTKLLRQIALNSGALQFLERGIGSTFQFLGGGA